MRAVVQRVSSAKVEVGGDVVGEIGVGLLVLVAAHREDTAADAARLADRVFGLRIFNDSNGKMNLAIKDLDPSLQPAVLAISNFTLYGETSKNRRPSFIDSAPYQAGESLYEAFVSELEGLGCKVETGSFGAHMIVTLTNDGPVTVIVDTR